MDCMILEIVFYIRASKVNTLTLGIKKKKETRIVWFTAIGGTCSLDPEVGRRIRKGEEEEAGLAFGKNTVDCKAKVKVNGERI